MKICDPLYGYIYFDQSMESIINLPLFQRLRSLQQLGFSEYAFPSGIGNRFVHSLGCSYLAERAFDSIFKKERAQKLSLSLSKKEEFKKTIKAAALLHDIGHGPLSHSSECLMPPLEDLKISQYLKKEANKKRRARHEDYSVKIIMETELFDALKQAHLKPSAVAQLIHKDYSGEEDFFKDQGVDYLPILKQIISSELDVDRMDYLHRDAFYCGVKYGIMDFEWLLSCFDHHQVGDQVFLAMENKSLYTIESFMLGRSHMRITVYFHHKAVIYNEMLKRYAETSKWKLPSNTQDYLKYTDSNLKHQLGKNKNNEWASRILDKNPYERLYEYNHVGQESKSNKEMDLLKKKLKESEIDFIFTNSDGDTITKERKDSDPIFIHNEILETTEELSKHDLIDVSRGIHRVYVDPKQMRDAKQFLPRTNLN